MVAASVLFVKHGDDPVFPNRRETGDRPLPGCPIRPPAAGIQGGMAPPRSAAIAGYRTLKVMQSAWTPCIPTLMPEAVHARRVL